MTQDLIELLWPLGPIVARPLLGTLGLFLDDRVFGVIHADRIYFRTADSNVERYRAAGSPPLTIAQRDGGRAIETEYYLVPSDVLADRDTACAWAYTAAS